MGKTTAPGRDLLKLLTSMVFSLPAAASLEDGFTDSAELALEEAWAYCSEAIIWQQNLCGPTILVDRESRRFVAKDLSGDDMPETGLWPEDRNISNSSVVWEGETWAMVMWPLPSGQQERVSLIFHENFHRIQDKLPFSSGDFAPANHLDEMQARVSIRLEMHWLARAVTAPDEAQRKKNAEAALRYRRMRLTSEGARTSERHLNIHEGLASFAGHSIAFGDDIAGRIKRGLLTAEGTKSFVRSFAYEIGPAWAYLLDKDAPGWRSQMNDDWDLADLYRQTALPATISSVLIDDALYKKIEMEERDRETKFQQKLAVYRGRFLSQTQLVLPQDAFTFDPTTAVALGDAGTVYETFGMRGDWGAFQTSKGVLISPDFTRISVNYVHDGTQASLDNEFWKLELNDGWVLFLEDGAYKVVRAARN